MKKGWNYDVTMSRPGLRVRDSQLTKYQAHRKTVFGNFKDCGNGRGNQLWLRSTLKRERSKTDLISDSAIKATVIMNQLILYPWTRTSTNNYHDMFPVTCPTIPKGFEPCDKTGFWRAKPLYLIQKDKNPAFSIILFLEKFFKQIEGLKPGFRFLLLLFPLLFQRSAEVI